MNWTLFLIIVAGFVGVAVFFGWLWWRAYLRDILSRRVYGWGKKRKI